MASRTPLAKTVGERIRIARHATGLSQDRFALVVGTSRRNIARWEGGHHLPHGRWIERIADETGHTQSWLYGREEAESIDEKLIELLHEAIDRLRTSALDSRAARLAAKATPTPSRRTSVGAGVAYTEGV